MGGKWLMKTFLKGMLDWLLLGVFGKVAGTCSSVLMVEGIDLYIMTCHGGFKEALNERVLRISQSTPQHACDLMFGTLAFLDLRSRDVPAP